VVNYQASCTASDPETLVASGIQSGTSLQQDMRPGRRRFGTSSRWWENSAARCIQSLCLTLSQRPGSCSRTRTIFEHLCGTKPRVCVTHHVQLPPKVPTSWTSFAFTSGTARASDRASSSPLLLLLSILPAAAAAAAGAALPVPARGFREFFRVLIGPTPRHTHALPRVSSPKRVPTAR